MNQQTCDSQLLELLSPPKHDPREDEILERCQPVINGNIRQMMYRPDSPARNSPSLKRSDHVDLEKFLDTTALYLYHVPAS